MAHTTLSDAALMFIKQHEAEHLTSDNDILVSRCVRHLVTSCETSVHSGFVATMQAMGEFNAKRATMHVDITLSTSHTVFVRDQENQLVAFTVSELVEWASQCSLKLDDRLRAHAAPHA